MEVFQKTLIRLTLIRDFVMMLFNKFEQVFIIFFLMVFIGCGSEKNSALVTAAGDGNVVRVEELLRQGANVNYTLFDSGITPLIAAASAGHIDVSRVLLSSGADINLKDDGVGAALFWAAFNGKLEMFHYLSTRNGKFMCDNKSAKYLLEIVKKRQYDDMEKLVLQQFEKEGIDM